jgi:serine/threonine-protein kinase PpkA
MDPAMNSDEHFSERFIREARISTRLVHPHILQIYDVNDFDGYNYIAMELLGFGDLADIIYSAMQQKTIYHIMEQMTELEVEIESARGGGRRLGAY